MSNVQEVQGVWLVAPGRLRVGPVEVGAPYPGEVQVEVKACGVCTGDVFKFRASEQEEHRFGRRRIDPYPIHFGHEGVGVVRAVGADVKSVRPGDKVGLLGDKHYAELVNVAEANVFRIPPEVKDYELWILEPVACTVNGLENARIRPGDRVLLIGCGFMGNLLLQGLKRTLAAEIMVADVDAARLDLARKHGPTEVFDSAKPADVERLRAYAKDRPFDVVIEAAGVEPALALAGDVLRRGGNLVMYSWQHGRTSINTTQWHLGGFKVYNASPFISEDFNAVSERTVRLMENGVFDLRPLLTHVADFKRAQEVFEAAVNRTDGYVKGVLRF